MRFTVQFPLDEPQLAEHAVDHGRLGEFAATAERAGFDAIAFTEHPAPSSAWLHGPYGHASLDPFSAAAYCAARTERLCVMPYLAVLPYRNPYVTAKAATTVDRLSGGRLVLCVGAGYLREEFDAMNLRFSDRAAVAREALQTMRSAWSDDNEASAPELRPRPVRAGGPRVWIGGNSARSRDDVVQHGDGWAPLVVAGRLAGELGTAGLASIDELAEALADLRHRLLCAGREPDSVDVQVKGPFSRVRLSTFEAAAAVETVRRLEQAGVTWLVVHPEAPTREGLLDVLERYGDAVISPTARRTESAP